MKYYLLIIMLFASLLCTSQTFKGNTVSFTFNDLSRQEVMAALEAKSPYTFYYLDAWLDAEKIDGNYTNVPFETLLEGIFSQTDLNFFIRDHKVILTQYNRIHDQLAIEASSGNQQQQVQEETAPVFYAATNTDQKKFENIVRIGKEQKQMKSKYRLRGKVLNLSGEPIPNLVIQFDGAKAHAIVDSAGNYSIALAPGLHQLTTSAIGIERKSVDLLLYSDGSLNFDLAEEADLLDEVIIDANRDKNIKEVVTGVTVINVEEIKNIPLVLGERDILKVATTMPGIKTAGEGAQGYSVRGGKEDQNLILLDQGVLYNPTHFFGIFSAVNPFATGEVNIYKGSMPVEYGGRLSSVFDIGTRQGSKTEFKGEGSIGPVTSNLTLEVPLVQDKASLLVGGRGTYSNWILRSLDEPSLQKSQASFYDVVAKYSHDISEKDQLEATGYFSRDQYSITTDSLFSYQNRLMTLKWDRSFNDKNSAALTLANSHFNFNIDYDGDSNTNFKLGYVVDETELKLNVKYLHSKEHKFNYGLSGKLYRIQPGTVKPLGSQSITEEFTIPREKAVEAAVFVADQYQFNEQLSFNLGLRYSMFSSLGAAEQNTYEAGQVRNDESRTGTTSYGNNEMIKFYGGLELRSAMRYQFNDNFSVKLSYDDTYQYIHTLTNNTTASQTDTWKLSDLNIKPQQARQVSLGFYRNLAEGNVELSVEGYYKKSKNILDFKVGANLLINENVETEVLQGNGKAYGVEFLLKKKTGNLNGWLGYSYARSFVQYASEFAENEINNGDYFSSNIDKPHDLSLVTNFKLTKRFSLSANFSYQTGRPVTYPVGKYQQNGSEYVLYSNRNEFRIPDYYRLDLGLNIEGNHKIKKLAHSFWNISVYNVLGRNNPYSVFFVTENGEVKAYKSSIFSIPVPTISYNFKF